MASEEEKRYKDIGFMCGLEIHQRLATAKKLFCDCPTRLKESSETMANIARYQRAVAGELGAIDVSAQFEELRNRKFVYNVDKTNSCLVEVDEEPPHGLNREALLTALAFASSMNMKIIDELQPMRKEVVDGSDPSAFQRTILIGIDGEIAVSGYKIKMPSLFLEEESCGIVSNTETESVYSTDRLGIPLVEIDTDPYIPTPAVAKEAALHIGTLIRTSGKVQRGIGTIRQDVNVSIRDGARVEIKGLQDVALIDKFIENEVIRQQKLLEIKDILILENAKVEEPREVTVIFRDTKAKVVRQQLDKSGVVLAFALKGFAGILGKEVNPGRRLGTEISDYAKMGNVNGIIHSDENLSAYGFSDGEMGELRKQLSMTQNDAFIIIAAKREYAEKAIKFAVGRAKHAMVGVPLETRATASSELCTTKFLRPLPSGSRMYPETDAKPIMITGDMQREAMRQAPDIEKEKEIISKLVENRDVAAKLLTSPKLSLFKRLVEETSTDPKLIANVLLQKFTELRRNGMDVDSISEESLIDTFIAYHKGKITKQAIDEVLKHLAKKEGKVDDIIANNDLDRVKGEKLRKLIESMGTKAKQTDINLLRNEIMAKYRLKIDGGELNEMLKK